MVLTVLKSKLRKYVFAREFSLLSALVITIEHNVLGAIAILEGPPCDGW